MPRITRASLIQASMPTIETVDPDAIKRTMIDKHIGLIEEAARRGSQICCLQELFYGPYFCAEQNVHWYQMAERVPDGPTIQLMQEQAKKHGMIMIVPVYEEDLTGVYYNTAAVIDEHGEFIGKYRKHHLPHCNPGFWEKFYFKPGDLGYPVFDTSAGRIGIYICYDRHFPEGARTWPQRSRDRLQPSATVAGLSEYLWKLEQPAHAVANQYYLGAINRVGTEAAMEHRRVLRAELLLRSSWTDRGGRQP